MKIHVFDEQEDLKIDSSSVEPIILETLHHEGIKCDEVIIHFVTKKTISVLHRKFFNDPSPTDCITFPIDDENESYRILGEIFICPQVALEYISPGDPYEETTLYLVHGLLHLTGYDDQDPLSKKKMRTAEKWHIKNLSAKGLLLRQ